MQKLLQVDNLKVSFKTNDGCFDAVRNLSFDVEVGESLAIVGESGSGKSQTGLAIMGLLAKNAVAKGRVRYLGRDILHLPEEEFNKIRASKIAMIFQDPMTSLNPYMRISKQLTEILVLHRKMSEKQAIKESLIMLDAVKIPDAKTRMHYYPHEFSGGMRQRVMIAMALLCRPKLLIADEATTALDVTVQAQIISLLGDIRKELGTSIILITHDLGIVAGFCNRVLVMYAGKIMEIADTQEIFTSPLHPYTKGLLAAVPRIDQNEEQLKTIPGEAPDIANLPPNCPFAPRCTEKIQICDNIMPPIIKNKNRSTACHLVKEEK